MGEGVWKNVFHEPLLYLLSMGTWGLGGVFREGVSGGSQ